MVEKARAANARLRAGFPAGFALDADHAPHITVLQRFVRTTDLDGVEIAVAAAFSQLDLITLRLEATGYYYLPWQNLGLAGITITPTRALLDLQQSIIVAVAPFSQPADGPAAFVGAPETPTISATVAYVEMFLPDRAGADYNPHVTVGLGPGRRGQGHGRRALRQLHVRGRGRGDLPARGPRNRAAEALVGGGRQNGVMTDSLASWREGEAKQAITGYVAGVCREGSPQYVAPPARIAVFDNDGTLWCERPVFVQAYFLVESLRAALAERPELAGDPVMRNLATGDLAGAVDAGGLEGLMQVVVSAHAGIAADAFAATAAAWLRDATHPRFGVPFRRLVYQPMLELIDLLRMHSFRVFVVTGGGVEFVRAVSEELYGIPPDDVVGSSVELELARIDEGLQLVRQARFRGSPNEGAPKAVNIQAHIGRRPILAGGNTAGDREMLEYAQTGSLPSLCLVIDHDDDEREYAYAGASFTDPGAEPIGTTAARLGWTVVSMRRDWAPIFPDGSGA